MTRPLAAAMNKDGFKNIMDPATKNEIPRPYSFLFHPLCFWIDKILSLLISLVVPVKIVMKFVPTNKKETMLMKERLQTSLTKNSMARVRSFNKKWSSLSDVPLVECTLKVVRQDDILVKWGITQSNELPFTRPEAEDFVTVLLRFPISILSEAKKEEVLTRNMTSAESGCYQLESFDLADIPTSVPILIWFHGGGFVLGCSNCDNGVEAITDLLEMASRFSETKRGITHPEAVLASVQYRLAPEHPFPAAPIDSLSVAAFFLESSSLRKINVAGVSAGGNLATVTALECYRRFPGRVTSLCTIAPMLRPATDTLSFYLESQASLHCPVGFLRWCWKSYLEMEGDIKIHFPDDSGAPDESLLTKGSTRIAWDGCKWKETTLNRLIDPALDIPLGMDMDIAPKVIVVTCTADPLRDDGVQLTKALKQADANVTHVDCYGTHVMGYMLDRASKAKVTSMWSEAIFGN